MNFQDNPVVSLTVYNIRLLPENVSRSSLHLLFLFLYIQVNVHLKLNRFLPGCISQWILFEIPRYIFSQVL